MIKAKEYKTKIVANHDSRMYVVHFVDDNGADDCLVYSPITAWAVDYTVGEYGGDQHYATPVLFGGDISNASAVINRDTEEWTIENDRDGKGIDELLACFQSSRDSRKRRERSSKAT